MTLDQIRAAIDAALQPGRFFLASGTLKIRHDRPLPAPWEVFRGHLLPPEQTRHSKTLETWTVAIHWPEQTTEQSLLAVHIDPLEFSLYVTRQILTYTWQAYEESPRVIASREVEAWSRELVGTLVLNRFHSGRELLAELLLYVGLAVRGTSRLPITSLQSPLPDFSLGRLSYLPFVADEGSAPQSDLRSLIETGVAGAGSTADRAVLLETVLRAADASAIPMLSDAWTHHARDAGLPASDLVDVLKSVFHHVALTPYTGFVDNLLSWLQHQLDAQHLAPSEAIDVLSYFLRHLVRHLTAFDLVTFHNLGANYPDALMLDAVLSVYLRWIEQHPDCFLDANGNEGQRAHRWRRRALRQAWVVRGSYVGHPIPDAPTSAGESRRVLPSPFARVPEEQILKPSSRRQRLFMADTGETKLSDTAGRALQQSIADLSLPAELCELGMAVFLDRPWGVFKEPGEVDHTPLFSYEAFSREIAHRRLGDLYRRGLLIDKAASEQLAAQLEALPIHGFAASELPGPERPGAAMLEDARKAAGDFRFLRTTRQSLDAWLAHYDLRPLEHASPDLAAWLQTSRDVLLVRIVTAGQAVAGQPLLAAMDGQQQVRFRLALAATEAATSRYIEIGGLEFPSGGLRLLIPEETERNEGKQTAEASRELILPLQRTVARIDSNLCSNPRPH